MVWDQPLAGGSSIPSVMLGAAQGAGTPAALSLSFQELCVALLLLHLQCPSQRSPAAPPSTGEQNCPCQCCSHGSGVPAQPSSEPGSSRRLCQGGAEREKTRPEGSEMDVKSCKWGRGESKPGSAAPPCASMSLIAWRFCRVVENHNLYSGTEVCSGPQCLVFRTV